MGDWVPEARKRVLPVAASRMTRLFPKAAGVVAGAPAGQLPYWGAEVGSSVRAVQGCVRAGGASRASAPGERCRAGDLVSTGPCGNSGIRAQ